MQVRTLTVALVGNPNAGKTTLFNALSGLRQRVGNYPGVTVESMKGKWKADGGVFNLVDLPGTYSLAPRSPDEMVAVDLLLGHAAGEPRPDAVVAVVDASNLDRHLYLVTQLFELGLPVVLALNMTDVAANQGVIIDAVRLERELGVPVVAMQANKGVGIEHLAAAVARAIKAGPTPNRVPFPEAFLTEVEPLAARLNGAPNYLVQRLLLDIGGAAEERYGNLHGSELIAAVRAARQRINAAGCPIPAAEAQAPTPGSAPPRPSQ